MLTGLSIRDVVLIDMLDLEFRPGLGVFTGETGAGKSILLDALGLALGARADSALVRAGRAQASVSATFELDGEHPAVLLLRDNGLEGEAGEPLVIRRVVRGDGGSRAFVNDQAVSAGLLRELGATLVEVHGQHDDRGLLNPRGHRALLDAFGEVDSRPVAIAWQRLTEAEVRLSQAREAIASGQRDREWLEHAVAELASLSPQAGEEEELASLRSAMQAGAKLGDELATIAGAIEGSEGGLSLLRQAARRLDRIAAEHPRLSECLAALDRAVIEASEAEDALRQAREALAFDPARLEEAESRLFELRGIARKHQVTPDQLPELADQLSERLKSLDAGEAGLADLEAELGAASAAYGEAAEALSGARREAARRLDQSVAGELAPLKLERAGFRTAIAEAAPGPGGKDRVEFEVSTNPGTPFGPLVRIASGGELSRFILALKVALHQQSGERTIIFDEIDRGVGGAVASAIGERLHRLSQAGQVLVVTHSPQVAARGAHHLLIEKYQDQEIARTEVHALDEDRRREEIARMLSGAQVTEEARAQASRLLEAA